MDGAGPVRRLLDRGGAATAGALLVLLSAACSASTPPDPGPETVPTPAPATIAVVVRDGGADGPARAAVARQLTGADYDLDWRTPAVADDAAAQAEVLAQALAAAPRALVLQAVDYPALLPYLRLAHDREVPVVVVDEPADPVNPTFVVAFVAPDGAAQAAALSPLLAPGPVLVAGRTGSARARVLAAELRRRLPGRAVQEQASPAATSGTVVLADPGPVPPAAAGVRVLSAVLTSSVTEALRAGRVVAAVAPTPCALLAEGVRLAVAAARNDPGGLPRPRDVPPTTLRRGTPEPPC